MSKTIENLKSGNYEVVDNQGVSVTINFIECLEKEFADLESKLQKYERMNAWNISGYTLKCFDEEMEQLKQQLAEKEKEIESLRDKLFYEQTDNAKHISGIIKLQFEQVQAEKDKISFCIEQLEKVSQDFSMRIGITDNNMDLLNEIIDNQIEELKKEKY